MRQKAAPDFWSGAIKLTLTVLGFVAALGVALTGACVAVSQLIKAVL